MDHLDGASGSTVLLLTDEALRLTTLGLAPVARLAVAAEDDRVSTVHEDSRVPMFVSYLEQVGSVVVRWFAAQLVDHGPQSDPASLLDGPPGVITRAEHPLHHWLCR